jgi:hypothetical protein
MFYCDEKLQALVHISTTVKANLIKVIIAGIVISNV